MRRRSSVSSRPRSPRSHSQRCGFGRLSAFRTVTLLGRRCLPGAFLVAVGLQVLHVLIVEFLAPKLEKATTLYGSIGAMTTILFFMYFAGRLVVTSPILNSSLHHELNRSSNAEGENDQAPTGSSNG